MEPFIAPSQRAPNLVSQTHYCVVGDVTVDATAAIAPGVVLQASPGSRIVVGRGASLAGGVCVQSRAGVLTLSAGTILGANVLVVGNGAIGENACVSPGSTLMNPQVAAGALLPPNTLLGQSAPQPTPSPATHLSAPPAQSPSSQSGQSYGYSAGSRQSDPSQNGTSPLPKNAFVAPGPVEPKPIQIPSIDVGAPAARYDPSKNGVQLNQNYDLSNGSNPSSAITAPSYDRVYGRDQVSQLISTLFPNRASR